MDHLFRLIYSRNHRSSREAPDVFRMPSPPRTPSRRRQSSEIDPVSTLATPQRKDISPQAYTANPYQLSSSRRTSLYSLPSPLTPGQTSSHDHRNSLETINGLYSTVDQVNGIGNLADELAEAWDEEDELELDDGGSPAQSEGPRSPHGEHTKSSESQFSHRDSVSLDSKQSSFSSAHWKRSLDSTRKKRSLQKHRRKHSPYGISDYSDESDFDDEMSISSSLETQMATIESLVRQGTESGCSETGGVIQRVADKLRDMSSQLSLEDSATRCAFIFFAQSQ